MKKITIIGLMSLCAVGAYAQGTLVFFNDIPNTIVTHIYSPNPASPTVAQNGNAANDFPAGSTVYGGTPIGGASGAAGTPINYSLGNNFTAQIYALVNPSGAAKPFSSLTPVSQYVTTLATTSAQGAGFIVQPTINSDPGIPNTGYDSVNQVIDNRATISLAAWYNAGGTITSYAGAVSAGVPSGFSTPFNLSNLGEPASVETAANGSPTAATNPKFMNGSPALTSFSLTSVSATPEPSTIALGLMGACAFLARRRKK
jgi:hypothetical protein